MHRVWSMCFCVGVISSLLPWLPVVSPAGSPPLLLLISMDGFRWDYLDLVKKAGKTAPNFDQLIASGTTVEAGGMYNVFPTKTMPNHYTMVTGMYPSSHGVVHNDFYDPRFNASFNGSTEDESVSMWWDNGTSQVSHQPQPIWLANQQDSAHRSGVMMWFGASAPIHNLTSFRKQVWNESISNQSRINQLMDWFTDPLEPINLGLLYFEEPDKTGHQFGPDSPQVVDTIVGLDQVLGYLITKLKAADLFGHMNIILTSDHGMIYTNKTNITLSHYVDHTTFMKIGSSPVFHIWPYSGDGEEIVQALENVSHITVYRKLDIPEEYLYIYNARIPPVVVVAERGYSMCILQEDCSNATANHGYNNSWSDMHPIFIAHGPAFKSNYISQSFHNVDLYPLMCYILGVQGGRHEGDMERIHSILRVAQISRGTIYTIVAVCVMLGLPVLLLPALAICRRFSRTPYSTLDEGIDPSHIDMGNTPSNEATTFQEHQPNPGQVP